MNMAELSLYNPDGEDDEISAEITAGYDVMYEKLKDSYESESELKSEICRMIEAVIFREIQEQAESPELHPAFVELLNSLQETGEVDMDSLTANSIHQLTQVENQ